MTSMDELSVKIDGRRYMVFDTDYRNAGGGFGDCVLITDDFKAAEKEAKRLISRGYYSSSNSEIFDIETLILRTYYRGSDVVEKAKGRR